MDINNPVAFSLLVVGRGKDETAGQARQKQYQAQGRHPWTQSLGEVINAWRGAELMEAPEPTVCLTLIHRRAVR